MLQSKRYIILLFNLLVMAASLWLKPRFQTNDDIGMIYAFSGTSIFSVPTAVTAFSTKIWGLGMVFLYQVFPVGIEVYTWVFYLLIFCSSVILHNKIFENAPTTTPLFWIIFIPILAFITLQFYLELQFTMVAGLTCFTGVLLWNYSGSKGETAIGVLLFILATLLRPGIVPVVLAFMVLYYFIAKVLNREKKESVWPVIKRYSLISVIFCTIYFIDKGIHTQEENRFLDFNLYRAGIVDFNFDKSESAYLPSNWQKEELFLFKNWFYNDTILYSRNVDYANAGGEDKGGVLNKIDLQNVKFFAVLNQFKDPLFRCMLLLALVPVFMFSEWKKILIFLISTLLLYMICFNVLSVLFKTPPFRVYFMLFSTGIFFYLYYVLHTTLPHSVSLMRTFVPALLILYSLWITRLSLEFRYRNMMASDCSEKYDPSEMYIRWAGYPFEIVDPFKVTALNRSVKIISMGAFSVHPAVINQFKDFRYNNLTGDIVGKETMVTFMMPADTAEWSNFRSAYTGFIGKHYNKKVHFEEVMNDGHCFGYKDFKLIEDQHAKMD